ncbi:MAG: hypothetical protein WDA02_03625 [Saccharofermentanales bacterium]
MHVNILIILLSIIVTILSIRLYRYRKLYKDVKSSYESVYKKSNELVGMCNNYLEILKRQNNIILELNGTINENNNQYDENHLNLDDILNKISKLGIESISKIEIDFLKNYKNI